MYNKFRQNFVKNFLLYSVTVFSESINSYCIKLKSFLYYLSSVENMIGSMSLRWNSHYFSPGILLTYRINLARRMLDIIQRSVDQRRIPTHQSEEDFQSHGEVENMKCYRSRRFLHYG
jgi:hypothetical protein